MYNLYLSFNLKKYGSLHCKRFWKHPLYATFSLLLTVTFVKFQINIKLQINHLKYIFTQDISRFQEKRVFSIAGISRNIQFLKQFY